MYCVEMCTSTRVADPLRRPTGASPSSCAGRPRCGTRPRRRRRPRRGRARSRRARARAARRAARRARTASSGSSSGSSTSHSTSIAATRCARLRERVGADGRDRVRPGSCTRRRAAGSRRGRSRHARRGEASAGARSIRATARAACGERSTAVCSIPGSRRSAVYTASPRARSRPSMRGAGAADDLARALRATARARPPRRRARPPRSGPRPLSRCGSVSPRADRLLDLGVRAAAAEVAGHARAGSPRVVGAGVDSDERDRAHDLARRAEAALHRVGAHERRRPSGGRAGLRSSSPRASSTRWASVMHESVGSPSTSTVHAPQCPSPQATFVPVSAELVAQHLGERRADGCVAARRRAR